MLGVVVLAALLVFGIPWIEEMLNTVSTDDAYVNGHVTFVAPRVALVHRGSDGVAVLPIRLRLALQVQRGPTSWRKLHLAVDADTGEIVANTLTENDADDIGEVPGLPEQIDGQITSFIADGAYDGEPVYQTVARQQHDPPPDVVISPRASAVLSTGGTDPAEAT